LHIEPPPQSSGLEFLIRLMGESITVDTDAPLQPARVKWFDKAKGFGFVNAFGESDDVFVHMEVLHACGLSDLQPGEAVCIRSTRGPRGLMAWDVQVWDNAIS
jgi:CspA family cold shock protein